MYIRYGPLNRVWCMRFEGKHNYFKDLAHRIKCFKNIPKTMASKHQQMMCYYRNSGFKWYKELTAGPGKCINNSLEMNVMQMSCACVIYFTRD